MHSRHKLCLIAMLGALYMKQLAASEFQVLTRGVSFKMEEEFGAFHAAMSAVGRNNFWPCICAGQDQCCCPKGFSAVVGKASTSCEALLVWL
jgi:hypothetical protein